MPWLAGYAVFSVVVVSVASWWAWYADIDDARATVDRISARPFLQQLVSVALATTWCLVVWPIVLVWALAASAAPDRADRPDR